MRSVRGLVIAIAGILVVPASGCNLAPGTASQDITAQERRLLVLIDATGSMTTARLDMTFPNRFEAARSISRDDLVAIAGDASATFKGARLFVFHNNGITEQKPPNPDPDTEQNPDPDGDGWFDAEPIRKLIAALPGPTGLTPMAGSMCDATDIFTGVAGVKTMATYSDGGENNTSTSHACYSADTATWQQNVQNHMLNADVQFYGTLFTNVSLAPPASDPEAAELAAKGGGPVQSLTGLSDKEFFAGLAMATGGKFRVVADTAPVPVFADVSNDSAVDRTDAILVAREFGRPVDPRFDLNNDGVIDFADYLIVVSRLGVGGGQPDPYQARQPLHCNSANSVVIEGQVIEDGGITIDAQSACDITIKDSLIVSGHNAITLVGAARLTVDNSIIVGQDALITVRGAARLSAANSVFHGAKDIRGQLKLTDRGGNVFE